MNKLEGFHPNVGFHVNVSFFLSNWVIYSVSDPDSLSPDPNPAFLADPGGLVFMTKNCNLLISGP